MVLGWAHENSGLARWSDNIRLLEALASVGLLASDKTAGLMAAYTEYRACAHRLALQHEKGIVPEDQFEAQRQLVVAAWERLLGH